MNAGHAVGGWGALHKKQKALLLGGWIGQTQIQLPSGPAALLGCQAGSMNPLQGNVDSWLSDALEFDGNGGWQGCDLHGGSAGLGVQTRHPLAVKSVESGKVPIHVC